MKKMISALSLSLLLAGCGQQENSTGGTGSGDQSSAGKSSASSDQSSAGQDADNTARNKRDRSDAALTPGDQGNTEADREMARNIRRAVVKNDQLSTTAKNIKIIVEEGKVTLRGPVKSEEERTQIASIAQQQTQGGAIDNQLEVKAATDAKPSETP
jgi:hyperosmotically inducible periplasmic protein